MTKNILTLLAFVFCFYAKAITPGKFANFGNSSSTRAEKLKDGLNSGEFTLSSFAFTENKGQIFGYDGLQHPEVKFSFHQGATQLFLLEKGIAYQFTKMHYPEGYLELMSDKAAVNYPEKFQELQKQIRTETFRMDMVLVGANHNAEISTEGKSTDYTNFYNYNVLDVHSYSKITYHNIYPGIDWVIYTKNHQIKYDFVVHPGADPSSIIMEFTHQEELTLNGDGSFTLTNKLGSITEKTPLSFQGGKNISTKFILKDKKLSFSLENYNAEETLIIDPLLAWATYYGGTNEDQGESCATDASGNVYLAGHSISTAGIASGGHQNTLGGNYDAFIVKFNSSGIRQWGTYYGGVNADLGNSCTTDLSGNVYLAGRTDSNAGISFGGHQNTCLCGGLNFSDAYLVKFNSSGIRQWATYYGETGSDEAYSCFCDVSGNVYLAGATGSTINIASIGHQNTIGGSTDAFLVKFNSSGVRQWGTYYGGTVIDLARSCATDASGNVYLSGYSASTLNIASGGHQNTIGGTNDAFLVKFNSSGVRQWGTYYGGAAGDIAISCITDVSGSVYLAGNTASSNGIGSGGHQNIIGGGADAFLARFNTSGVLQWGTYYGGTGSENGMSCISDASGNLYFSGASASTNNIAFGGYQNTNGGGANDAFLAKFTSSGVRQWGTYYGGTGEDFGYSCVGDALGNVYLAGYSSTTASIVSGGHQTTYGGGTFDAFLVKFCDNPAQPSGISGNTVMCFGSAQNYSVTNDPSAISYNWTLPGAWTGSSSTHTIALTAGSSGIFSLTALNACGASPVSTLNVVVNPLPIITVNSGSICTGQSFTIVPSGAMSYTNLGFGSSMVVSPTSNSSYSIVGSSAEGCISTIAAISNVSVNPLPVISVSNGTICLGKSFTITPGGAVTYTYSGGSAVVSPSVNSSYTVSGTSSAGCANFALVYVSVDPLPNILLSGTVASICAGESITLNALGATTYTWSNGANGTVIVINPNVTSTYSITGTDSNGCENTASITQNVDECVGIDQLAGNSELLTIYPNPNNGEFFIEAPKEVYITVFNPLGQIILQQNLSKGKNKIDFSNQAKGIYFIEAKQNGKISRTKIIKY